MCHLSLILLTTSWLAKQKLNWISLGSSSSSTSPVVPSSVTTIPGSSFPSSVPSSVTTISGLSFPSSVSTTAGSSFPFFGLPPPVSIDSQTLPNFNSVAALATPNVTNLVTIKLGSVEDYLTWRTQFTSLLLSHELMGFVDGSIPHPSPLLGDAFGNHQPNPLYRSWIRIDQSVSSWLFATLSRNVLLDVHLLPASRDIWLSLHRRYMDATINSPVPSQDFIDHVLLGLGKEYDTLVGIITHFPGHLSLEKLRTKLLLHEQRLQRFKELDSPITHQAFVAHSVSTPTQDSDSQFGSGRGRGRSSSRGCGRGGKGRGFGGRGQQPQINSSNYNTRISATGHPQLSNGGTYHVSYNSYSDKASGQTLIQESSKADVYPLSSKLAHSPSQALVALRQSGNVL
ncbi:hypothetical protein H5410_013019 [Solanum commersonii]|uniref:Retrotransposon Copia-like N-terminal domain-containing protein n=1 Tax=Solanum commersonii TaxID=4109 RepID=A0A9J6ATY9_SOLCO|nr:hypothetical protein H5410_013019 [Solanum commersonii]